MASPISALGLMSGTSMDGIDAAILTTDGEAKVETGPALSRPYPEAVRARIKEAVDAAQGLAADAEWPDVFREAEREVTLAHAAIVKDLLDEAEARTFDVALLGFHGQTVLHQPARAVGEKDARSIQLGNGELLAQLTGIPVINDFRSADIAAGGEGAPLAPLYHAAIVRSFHDADVMAVVNIGGVANVTFVDATHEALLAFDTGPGNGPIDEWIEMHTGAYFDRDGALAASGRVHDDIVASMLDNSFFDELPPKSLDRYDFTFAPARGLALADGAATLTAFTAASIAASRSHFPRGVERWVICGGGRNNPTLMAMLCERVDGSVVTAEDCGWRGDFLEAEACAYLAVRSELGLSLSLPTTTGVSEPLTGGTMHLAPKS